MTLIYQTDDNSIRVDVHLEDESVWLTQAQMAILLENTVVWKFRTTAQIVNPTRQSITIC